MNTRLLFAGGGTLLIFITTLILCWRERSYQVRKLCTQLSSLESEETDCGVINPEREGTLVYMKGQCVTDKLLWDAEFNMQFSRALSLSRSVEMLQWQEHQHEHRHKHSDGSETVSHTYTYTKVWVKHHIISAFFHEPGHHNPDNLVIGDYVTVLPPRDAHVGAFVLNQGLLEAMLETTETVPIGAIPPISPGLQATLFTGRFRDMSIGGSYLYINAGGWDDVGSLRVLWSVSPTGPISFCSEQRGDSFIKHNFVSGQNNFRSKLLGEKIEQNKGKCPCCLQWCLLGGSDLGEGYQALRRGTYPKDAFFEAEKEDALCWRNFLNIIIFLFLVGGFGLAAVAIKPEIAEKHWYLPAGEGALSSVIWMFLVLAVIKYTIDPVKIRTNLILIILAIVGLATEQVLFYTVISKHLQ